MLRFSSFYFASSFVERSDIITPSLRLLNSASPFHAFECFTCACTHAHAWIDQHGALHYGGLSARRVFRESHGVFDVFHPLFGGTVAQGEGNKMNPLQTCCAFLSATTYVVGSIDRCHALCCPADFTSPRTHSLLLHAFLVL